MSNNHTSCRMAVIDIGTITMRLLIADVDGLRVNPVVRETTIVHVGEGLASTGCISDAAFERVCACAKSYLATINKAQCNKTFLVATSASRDAKNGAEFMAMLESLGLDPRIIPGEEEASYSFLGVASEFEGKDILVSDTGGGSTELILGDSTRTQGGALEATIHFAKSIDVGARRVTDAYLASDPVASAEVVCARKEIRAALEPAFRQMGVCPKQLIMVAGTATTASAVLQELEAYDSKKVHGSLVTKAELASLIAKLSAMNVEQRKFVPGIEPSRAGVIVGGLLVLEATLALSGLDMFTVSETDLLQGFLLDKYQTL